MAASARGQHDSLPGASRHRQKALDKQKAKAAKAEAAGKPPEYVKYKQNKCLWTEKAIKAAILAHNMKEAGISLACALTPAR